VLPPRLAPKQVVILPIYRNDEEQTTVLEYCNRLKRSLEDQQYSGKPIRVAIDDRDLRGGEKTWHHIKRGVPLRAEIGPRDVAANSVFVGRRDTGTKDAVDLDQFVSGITDRLTEIQSDLFSKADQLRRDNTKTIDSLDDFQSYFTPSNPDQPEIHGGFSLCHWCEDPAVDELLKKLKVTIRCLPLDQEKEPGACVFTGQPSQGRAVFAKAY